jgi:hypothetical protein
MDRDWKPTDRNCDLVLFSYIQLEGNNSLSKPNDGMVLLSSVESLQYSDILGYSRSCHTNLLSKYEYGLVKDVLKGNK